MASIRPAGSRTWLDDLIAKADARGDVPLLPVVEELVPTEQRLTEIQQRYGPGHLVTRSIQRATPMILRAVEQVQDRAARST